MDNLNNDNFDFNDLKSLWQSSLENSVASDNTFDNHKILTIMQEKISSAVKKIRRNLLIEILTTIPLLIGGYFISEARGLHLPIFYWVGIILITIGYHVYLYWKLQKETVSITTVSETIKKQHANLHRFIKMYDILAIVGGIVFCLVSSLFFYAHYKDDVVMFTLLMLLSLSSGYGFYAFVHWYIQKLYGQHYSLLEESQKVLEQK